MTLKEAQPAMRLTNVEDGETIHHRCLLITGTCRSSNSEDFLSVKTTGANNLEAFPEQTWPVHSGYFKALVMLSPGSNTIEMMHHEQKASLKITLQYMPLLQYPPLHLAIMVAKDSPLLMDCPPQKAGGFSSAHSDLSAAIEKFRMTAYMWQAMTAEDFRVKGLGRRTFRLEEEWTTDTVSRDFVNAQHSENHGTDSENAIRSTAKVNIIKSAKSKKDILYAEGEDARPTGRNKLFSIFMEALADHGGQFDSSCSPVVAGLILDAHYNKSSEQILGHVSHGRHNPSGISLGTFGSHLTYSWPRFTEEVASCLTDARVPGVKLAQDNHAIWESCAFGQSSFLSAVGLAFGVRSDSHKHGDLNMTAQNWQRQFLPSADPSVESSDDVSMTDCAKLDLKDALNLRFARHFLLPTDKQFTDAQRNAEPMAEPKYTDNEKGELEVALHLTATVGIARISFNKVPEAMPSISSPINECEYSHEDLEQRFDRSQPLRLDILGLNGKELTIENVWKTLAVRTFVRIPGSSIRLYKRSVYTEGAETSSADNMCEWAQLLKERGTDGNVHRATSIDLRVGCWWDGGVVEYSDGHKSHWGPMRTGGREHEFGGHASELITLPPNTNIKHIDLNRGSSDHHMQGVRMRLTNGTACGELNTRRSDRENVVRLKPASHEVIVGFYGKSGSYGILEFGIITVSKNVGLDGLPDAVYDLPELKNTADMGDGERNFGNRGQDTADEGSDDDNLEDDDSDGDDDNTINGDD